MGAAIVPQLRILWGDKLDPSTSDNQPKTHYHLLFAEVDQFFTFGIVQQINGKNRKEKFSRLMREFP